MLILIDFSFDNAKVRNYFEIAKYFLLKNLNIMLKIFIKPTYQKFDYFHRYVLQDGAFIKLISMVSFISFTLLMKNTSQPL